ncbi:MAG: DUF1540 domain-containing protein [Clostridiales bacterium]|jgi:hypothetical protein|nr:DUF1540 domain-containing protein [Clostridiales bacterium]
MAEQNIKCNVGSCKYNEEFTRCSLSNIVVGDSATAGIAQSQKETECTSFVQD